MTMTEKYANKLIQIALLADLLQQTHLQTITNTRTT